jgi:hypothetical protein
MLAACGAVARSDEAVQVAAASACGYPGARIASGESA